MTISRRQFLVTTAAAGATAVAAPAIVRAQGSADRIRVGYLHTLAVDGHIWTAESQGLWAQNGLQPEFTQFSTGLELFQAMVGGSLDMLATGAVLSNFPARGQGKVFLINNVEFATAQLWVNPALGVSSFEDLRGKPIATTVGTTAHVFLDTSLKANGLDPASDVSLVNQRMPDAVTAFISGAVPAVALWVPFNVQLKQRVPNAVMLEDASNYYPQAAIIGGWAAANAFHAERADVLERVVQTWLPANRELIENSESALRSLSETRYADVPLSDLQEQYNAQRLFPAEEWARMYEDGTVTGWLNRVTDFYASVGGMTEVTRADEYFDPSIFLKVAG